MVYWSKKYNIYYVYNYILPQSPLKNRHFYESMILASWQYVEYFRSCKYVKV